MKISRGKFFFIKQGWRTLHDVALNGGAQADLDPDDDGVIVYPDLYTGILYPIPCLTGICPEDFGFLEEHLKRVIEYVLIERMKSLGSNFIDQLAYRGSSSHLELLEGFNNSEFAQRTGPVSRGNPSAVAIKAFRLIKSEKCSNGALPGIGWGLALIGWANSALSKIKQCAYCPRMAAPGSKYCFEHGYSDLNPLLSHGRSLKVQYTKNRGAKKARQSGMLPYGRGTPNPFESFFGIYRMTSLLMPSLPAASEKEMVELHNELRRSPNVLDLVGGESVFQLAYPELFERLIDRLAPYLVQYTGIAVYTILEFEEFLSVEKLQNPGKRGKGVSTAKRIDQAIKMAQNGESQAKISHELKVHESTVSTWKKKYPDFRIALKIGRRKI